MPGLNCRRYTRDIEPAGIDSHDGLQGLLRLFCIDGKSYLNGSGYELYLQCDPLACAN